MECPKSVVLRNPHFKPILSLLASTRHIHDASGATLFGADSSRWLGWWADTVEIEEIYRKLEQNAQSKAELSEHSSH